MRNTSTGLGAAINNSKTNTSQEVHQSKGLQSYFSEIGNAGNIPKSSNQNAYKTEFISIPNSLNQQLKDISPLRSNIQSNSQLSQDNTGNEFQSTGLLTALKDNFRNLKNDTHQRESTSPLIRRIEVLESDLKEEARNFGLLDKNQLIKKIDSVFSKEISGINKEMQTKINNRKQETAIFSSSYRQRNRKTPEETTIYKQRLMDIFEKQKSNDESNLTDKNQKISDELTKIQEEDETFIKAIIKKTDELITNFKDKLSSKKIEKIVQTEPNEEEEKADNNTKQNAGSVPNRINISALNFGKTHSPNLSPIQLKGDNPFNSNRDSKVEKFQELMKKSHKPQTDRSRNNSNKKEEQKVSDTLIPSKSFVNSTENNLEEILELSGEQKAIQSKIDKIGNLPKRTSISIEEDQRQKEIIKELVSTAVLPGETFSPNKENKLRTKRKVFSKSYYNSQVGSAYGSPQITSSMHLKNSQSADNRVTFGTIPIEKIVGENPVNDDEEQKTTEKIVVRKKSSRRPSKMMSVKATPLMSKRHSIILDEKKDNEPEEEVFEFKEDEDEASMLSSKKGINKPPIKSPNSASSNKMFDFKETNGKKNAILESQVLELSEEESMQTLRFEKEKQQEKNSYGNTLKESPNFTKSNTRGNTMINVLTIIQPNSKMFLLNKMFEPDTTFKYLVDYNDIDSSEYLKEFPLIEQYLEILWEIKLKPLDYKSIILFESLKSFQQIVDFSSIISLLLELKRCQILLAISKIHEAEDIAENIIAKFLYATKLTKEVEAVLGEFHIIVGFANLMKSYRNHSLTRIFTCTKAFESFQTSYAYLPQFNRKRRVGEILLESLNDSSEKILELCRDSSQRDSSYSDLYNFLQLSGFLHLQKSEDEKNILVSQISRLISDPLLSYLAFIRLYSHFEKKKNWKEMSKVSALVILNSDTMEDTNADKINYLHSKALYKSGFMDESLEHSLNIVLMKLKGFLASYFVGKYSNTNHIQHIVPAYSALDNCITNLSNLSNKDILYELIYLKARCLQIVGFNITACDLFADLQAKKYPGIQKEITKKEIDKELHFYSQAKEIQGSILTDVNENILLNNLDNYSSSLTFERKVSIIQNYDLFLANCLRILLQKYNFKSDRESFFNSFSHKIESWFLYWKDQYEIAKEQDWSFQPKNSMSESLNHVQELLMTFEEKFYLLILSRNNYLSLKIEEIFQLMRKDFCLKTEYELLLYIHYKTYLQINSYEAFHQLKNQIENLEKNENSQVSNIFYYYLGQCFSKIKAYEIKNQSGYFMESKSVLLNPKIGSKPQLINLAKNSLQHFLETLKESKKEYRTKANYYLAKIFYLEGDLKNAREKFRIAQDSHPESGFFSKKKRYLDIEKLK